MTDGIRTKALQILVGIFQILDEKQSQLGDLSCHFELNVADPSFAVLDLGVHNRLERRQKKSFHVILFQPRAIEIYGFTDEGVARSFAEFLGETIATSPLGRGEAYASGFVILIILIHEL